MGKDLGGGALFHLEVNLSTLRKERSRDALSNMLAVEHLKLTSSNRDVL